MPDPFHDHGFGERPVGLHSASGMLANYALWNFPRLALRFLMHVQSFLRAPSTNRVDCLGRETTCKRGTRHGGGWRERGELVEGVKKATIGWSGGPGVDGQKPDNSTDLFGRPSQVGMKDSQFVFWLAGGQFGCTCTSGKRKMGRNLVVSTILRGEVFEPQSEEEKIGSALGYDKPAKARVESADQGHRVGSWYEVLMLFFFSPGFVYFVLSLWWPDLEEISLASPGSREASGSLTISEQDGCWMNFVNYSGHCWFSMFFPCRWAISNCKLDVLPFASPFLWDWWCSHQKIVFEESDNYCSDGSSSSGKLSVFVFVVSPDLTCRCKYICWVFLKRVSHEAIPGHPLHGGGFCHIRATWSTTSQGRRQKEDGFCWWVVAWCHNYPCSCISIHLFSDSFIPAPLRQPLSHYTKDTQGEPGFTWNKAISLSFLRCGCVTSL